MNGPERFFDRWLGRRKPEPQAALAPRQAARARARLDAQDYVGALRDCDAVLAALPTHHETHVVRGAALYHLGRPDAALLVYDRLARTRSDSDDHVWRAVCLQSLGRHREARAAADDALRLDPCRVDALHVRSRLHWALGDTQAALDDLDRVLRSARDKKPLYRLKAEALIELGRNDDVLFCLDQLLALNGLKDEALALRPETREKCGDLAGALADVERRVEILPRNAAAAASPPGSGSAAADPRPQNYFQKIFRSARE